MQNVLNRQNMLTVNLPSSQTHPLVRVTVKTPEGPDHDDVGRLSRDLGSSDSQGDARGADRSHGPTV